MAKHLTLAKFMRMVYDDYLLTLDATHIITHVVKIINLAVQAGYRFGGEFTSGRKIKFPLRSFYIPW
jgi:hypothetical protein